MTLNELKESLPSFAKDIKLNLSSVLKEEGTKELTQKQIYGIALASALATRHEQLSQTMVSLAAEEFDDEALNAVKAAVTIMAMNNIYYRFVHLTSDKEYSQMPARLRMNVMANPGIDKIDFELYSLAVSAINGCGLCIDSHTKSLRDAGVSKVSVQSVVRIAAVVNATAQALTIDKQIM